MGLLEDSKLRESWTKRPPEDMRQLIRRIEEYKRLEDDRLQSKGKAALANCPRQSGFQPRSRKDFRIQEPELLLGEVNVTFKEPIHKIVDQIKNKPYFKCLNKIGGVTRPAGIRICIVPIIGTRGIPLSNAGC